ncbi:alpha/beta hydrolase [Antrihabitans cavernicola]|uniref:Alpha/beta hydrolase n=1 Tax=Antrihabitans cavernicola TaxID=2495913 RepID=A0A5A7SFY8_9NOCA|nr:alpha/beta hydrolase [Spelaeibacter cavernicola]KAA0024112.1 alpha/beta hydrolase [Spelaeibacter cavernicola]
MRRRRRPLKIFVALIVVLAIVYAGISWFFSEKLIAAKFAPLGPVDVASYGLPQPELIEIPGDGVTLAGWYFANPRKAGCATVMLHGFSGSKQEILGPTPLFWNRGCDLLLYDARGHGESSPSLLTYGAHEKDDLGRAVDWLANRTSLPHSKIGLAGWSYGAATAIQAAADIPDLAFVLADSSYSSLGDIARAQGKQQFGSWTKIFVPGALLVAGIRGGFDARGVAPDDAIRDVKEPTLLIHSRQDEFTPVEQSEEIYANSDHSHTELVIPDWVAPHAFSYTKNNAGYTAILDGFLAKYAPDFGARA